MKKGKLIVVGLIMGLLFVNSVSASVPAYSFNDLGNTITVNQNGSSNLGYVIGNKFVCYTCGSYIDSDLNTALAGPISTTSGIGIYYKNNKKWESGSYTGSPVNDNFSPSAYPMSAFFTVAKIDNTSFVTSTSGESYGSITSDGYAENFIGKYMLTGNGDTLSKTTDNVVISITVDKSDKLKNKNFIKLNYMVENKNSAPKNVYVATFNDLYIGEGATADTVCRDNASYETNNNISNITKGFNAKTGSDKNKKFMTVVLKENSGLLTDGGGEFKYWAGSRSLGTSKKESGKWTFTLSNVVNNLFNEGGIPAKATAYADSEFAYSWNKEVPANTTVEFSTLIGLGNLEDVAVTVDKDKISPNYNQDKAQFTLTTDDKQIHIGGTITDKCGMGKCTYTINGYGPFNCDDEIYYTDNSFTTTYNTSINTKDYLTDTEENTFVVKAESVACGTATAEHKFTLYKDRESNKKTGINTNYIALGVILMGGIGLYIYSRKQNKFPQV